jgi:hypothetical protein
MTAASKELDRRMSEQVEEPRQPAHVRRASEIATRALALFGVVGVGLNAPRDDVAAWLKETGLWCDLSPQELTLFEASSLSRQMIIDSAWRSEALTVLLWSLHKIDKLPEADEQCDTIIFQRILPPYTDDTVEKFVNSATRRSDEDLFHLADIYANLHAEYRFSKQQNRPPRQPVRGEIVQERHHAINWIVGHDCLDWDIVTTDT